MKIDHPKSAAYAVGFDSQNEATPPQTLAVEGEIPDWLVGTLVRTGPSQFEVGEYRYRHWFDGLAMLHGFDIRGGVVRYQSKMLDSETLRAAKEQGRIARSEFATDPCRTLFGRIASVFSRPLTDNCNVNITTLGDRWITMTETRLPMQFDPESLTVRERHVIEDSIKGPICTAHPQIDVNRGLSYHYTVDFGFRTRYRFFSIDEATGRQKVVAEIPVSRPAYMHSFGMTENHLVLTEFPLVVNPLRLKFSGDPFIRNYRWAPERGLRFHLIDKASGRVVRRATADASFSFHHVNSFEKGDEVVIDLIAYPDCDVIDQLYLDRLRSDEPITVTGRLTRFRWSANGQITERILSQTPIELPRIDTRRLAQSYRHVFGASVSKSGDFLDSLVKINVENGMSDHWKEDDCFPGEPIFVACSGKGDDDQGALLSVVLKASTAESFLLVLDAKTMNEMARVKTPRRIPFGFHGHFKEHTDAKGSR